jgi:hypothetical protein
MSMASKPSRRGPTDTFSISMAAATRSGPNRWYEIFTVAPWRSDGRHCAVFNYRLAPWPRTLPRCFGGQLLGCSNRIAFIGYSAGGGLLLATLHKMGDEGFKLPSVAVALTGRSLHSNTRSNPLMDMTRLGAVATNGPCNDFQICGARRQYDQRGFYQLAPQNCK